MLSIENGRDLLKGYELAQLYAAGLDREPKGSPPPAQKEPPENAPRFPLPDPMELPFGRISLLDAIRYRRSRRKFASDPIPLEELAFILWITQGVRKFHPEDGSSLRNVPSGGSRHTLESYIAAINVIGLKPGIYRYLALSHELVLERHHSHLPTVLKKAAFNQEFVGSGAFCLIWTTLPARMEWAFNMLSAKIIAIDTGHVAQNLYLSCEAAQAATTVVASYDQQAVDELLQVDGENEFAILMAPVGRVLPPSPPSQE